jgi:hypothetical protein
VITNVSGRGDEDSREARGESVVAAVRVDLRGGSSSGESTGIFDGWIAAVVTFAVASERDTIFALLISSNRIETSLLDELRRGAALSDRGLPRRRCSHAHHAQRTRNPQQVHTKK